VKIVSRMMLHVTHVDDSVRGRQEPCVYFWGVTHHLSLLMKSYITATRKKLESRSPPLNVNELNIYQLYCVLVNKEWLRARVLQPELSPLGTVEVFCIDTGETHFTPLCFLRNVDITGMEADHIRKSPPVANKFILADMVKPRLPDSQWTIPAMNFLKAHLKDQSWEAVPLSNYAGVQIVRLHDATNQLFVSRMIEQRLGVSSQTYQKTLCMGETLNEQPIPDSTTVFKLLPTLNTSPVTVTEVKYLLLEY
jgi:tudor domain-containing protein 1/4/6/7